MGEGEAAAPQPRPETGGEQPEGGRPRGRRKPGRRDSRPSDRQDDPRIHRPRADRAGWHGYGDGVERALCQRYRHRVPPAYPVQHRQGLATIPPQVVDRRDAAVLLCDGQHPDEHIWPDGEPVHDSVDELPTIDSPTEVFEAAAEGSANFE